MRRIVSLALITAIAAFGPVLAATPAAAQSERGCSSPKGCVLALSVTGYVDAIMVDFMERSVRDANNASGYLAVVLVVDSPGVVVSDASFSALVSRLRASKVPVSAWVGPSGAQAIGGSAELVAALSGSMAPNTSLGNVGTPRLDPAVFGAPFDGKGRVARTRELDEKQAVKAGIVERVDPTLGDHALAIKGIPSKQVKDSEGRPKREVNFLPVNEKLPVTTQLLHTAASPAVAYLTLALAIGLLLFEFFTAGIGVAGVVGAVCAVLAGYGLGTLPIRPWALGLCLFSMFAFAIDIQTAIPRLWTWIGLICWSVGSVFLFDGFRVPWLPLATGIGGMAATMLSGMPSMVRSRFATPTLGRDWMIGREGVAVLAVDPEGVAEVDGGQWRALTNRATPIAEGEPLRVVAIDGLVLEVEPLEGGAVDYREQRKSKQSTANDS